MINYGAVILAGGKGTRFKQEKQFIMFEGKVLWKHVYDKVSKIVDKDNIIVVGVDVPGGSTRTESVIKGLNNLSPDTKRVLIIEAARPLVTEGQIKELLVDNHLSSAFVMPLVNTVIKKDGTYLDRDELLELLTPQAFDYSLLKEAYDSQKFLDMTDETRVMFEFYGIEPNFIEGGQNLIKLTYKRDLPIIEAIAEQQREGEF
jgi:2-C-methyl-D-erythritol 4-phosphate cytidylyltransferase